MRKASLSHYQTLPFAALKSAQSSSLLPILYQTRTLLLEPKTARRFHTFNRQVSDENTSQRTFCSTPQRQADSRNVSRHDQDPINFDPHHREDPATPRHTQPPRPSTVTKSEQAAFNRLIKDIPQPTTPEPDDEDFPELDELISGYDPDIDLDSIFESAINGLRRQKEQDEKDTSRRTMSSNKPTLDNLISDEEPTLSARLFKRPLGYVDHALRIKVENEQERVTLEMACYDHKNLVMGMLDSANSDVEIWQVLEQEVFSLINHLNEHVRVIQRSEKLHSAKVRKIDAEGKEGADVKLEKGDITKQKTKSDKLTRTTAIPINNLLLILHRNYADYCLHALRLFRRNHPLSSYGPLVFSTIKRRGPMSYVLGMSTDIYNEILFLQWTQYSDLHGMADTIEEMLNQGIEYNEVTMALIRGISEQRRFGIRGLLGPVVSEWWNMSGNVEGWRNMLQLSTRLRSESAERVATVTVEGQSEHRGLETDSK